MGKLGVDLFCLRDETLEDSASLPDRRVIAGEIAEDLRSALERIESILGDLQTRVTDWRTMVREAEPGPGRL
jgi:type I restriction enzyme M protein